MPLQCPLLTRLDMVPLAKEQSQGRLPRAGLGGGAEEVADGRLSLLPDQVLTSLRRGRERVVFRD